MWNRSCGFVQINRSDFVKLIENAIDASGMPFAESVALRNVAKTTTMAAVGGSELAYNEAGDDEVCGCPLMQAGLWRSMPDDATWNMRQRDFYGDFDRRAIGYINSSGRIPAKWWGRPFAIFVVIPDGQTPTVVA